jgi:hypothetical protein
MQQPSNDFSCWAGDGTTVTGSDGRSVFRNCPGSETVLVAFHTRLHDACASADEALSQHHIGANANGFPITDRHGPWSKERKEDEKR